MDALNEAKPTVSRRRTPAESQSCSADASSSQQPKVPRRLGVRYWTSREEMRLVELWYCYKSEITTFDTHLPIFRTIAEAMKKSGFFYDTRECRRKINSLKNRYIAERGVRDRPEYLNEKKALQRKWRDDEWPLFDLINCIFCPTTANSDPLHETQTINSMLSNIPQSHLDSIFDESGVDYSQINAFYQNSTAEDPYNATQVEAPGGPTDLTTHNINKGPIKSKGRVFDDFSKPGSLSTTVLHPFARQKRKHHRRVEKPEPTIVSSPLGFICNKTHLEYLREKNRRLEVERDQALELYEAQKRELEFLTSVFGKWEKGKLTDMEEIKI